MKLSELTGTLPISGACSLIVTIPAKNEEAIICDALGAMAAQEEARSVHAIVFANNCTDATADVVRDFAGRHPRLKISVVEGCLREPSDHVGTARKALMDYAANHFFEAAKPDGIVATTDADTCVAPDWIKKTFEEMQRADAVAGLVEIGPIERARMPAAVRDLYAGENEFRRAWAELESLVDPLPEDPYPRHCSFVAASFAVTARMYRLAGGIPDVGALEDRLFLRALRRVDARVRFSPRVRAFTSGRHDARVTGGFGTLVKHLHLQGQSGGTFMVENPRQICDEVRSRAAVRRIWNGLRDEADLEFLRTMFGIPAADILRLIDRKRPFGESYERIQNTAPAERNYALVPVGEAIEALRAAAAELKTAAPARTRAASGAG